MALSRSLLLLCALAGARHGQAYSRYRPGDLSKHFDIAEGAAGYELQQDEKGRKLYKGHLYSGRSQLTVAGSYPRQDNTYGRSSAAHSLVAVPCVLLLVLQWARTKGDASKVLQGPVGTAIKWLVALLLLTGWALQWYKLFLQSPPLPMSWKPGDPPIRPNRVPKAFESHPAIFTPLLGNIYFGVLGLSTTVTTLNVCYIGVDRERRIAFDGLAYWGVLALTLLSLLSTLLMYAYLVPLVVGNAYPMVATTIAGHNGVVPRTRFEYEMVLETLALGLMGPIFDTLNLNKLINWNLAGGELQQGEHAAMNTYFLSSHVLGAILLFVAHDAYHIWGYPGLDARARMAVRLLPQLVLLAPNVGQLRAYVWPAPSKTATKTLRSRESADEKED